MSSRIQRVNNEIEKLNVERQALEWIETILPVEYRFTAVTYPSYFSMKIKTLIEYRNTPTAEIEMDKFQRYNYPVVSIDINPWQIYNKLVTIFEPHECLYYGVDSNIAGVYTKDEFRYMNSSKFAEKHPRSRHLWTRIMPYYIECAVKNDIVGNETVSKNVDLYDAKLVFYVKTPFTIKAYDGLEKHVPLKIEIETNPKNLGLVGVRYVVRSIYQHAGEKFIYGKGHIVIEDDSNIWTAKPMSGQFYRFIVEEHNA